jgi:hypothetical protein
MSEDDWLRDGFIPRDELHWLRQTPEYHYFYGTKRRTLLPISPDKYLLCNKDGWISVRSTDGVLLGCIPGAPPQEDYINAPEPLGSVAVWSAMVFCLVPTPEQIQWLSRWPGFVPVATPPTAAQPLPSDQSDLAEAP